MKEKFKKYIKNLLYERRVLRNRYLDSVNDLNKSYPKLDKFLSVEQKREVWDFWEKYLTGKYPRKYFDIRWFDVYNSVNLQGTYDLKYYIPDGFYYCIIDIFFSNHDECYTMDDKSLYDLYFPEINRPQTIIRKENGLFLDEQYQLIGVEKALGKCINQQKKLILKPSVNSCGGRGINYWDPQKSSEKELKDYLEKYESAIIQECVAPHELFCKINRECLSTLRIVTLIFNGQVHVVSSVLIMAGKGAKTNHLHSGGLVCGILSDGHMKDYAYDGAGNCYQEHPNGIVFSKTVIPGFQKCVDLVKTLAPRLSRVTRLIGWDLTIDSYGEPILIEANMTWGGLCQIANGPIFGSLTPSILDYVAENSPYFK